MKKAKRRGRLTAYEGDSNRRGRGERWQANTAGLAAQMKEQADWLAERLVRAEKEER